MNDEEQEMNGPQPAEHETLRDELLHSASIRFKAFMNWLKPNPGEPAAISALRYFYKIPAVIAAVILSPVVLAILLIIFVVSL